MPLPLVAVVIGSAVGGAFVFDKITGAAEDAGNALESGGGALIKVAALAGLALLAFEVFKRGGFGGGN